MRAYLASIVVLLTGCDLYFGDDPPPPCADYGYTDGGGAAQQLRDPSTGLCESFGGGWGGCDSQCGPCAAEGDSLAPLPDWGTCYSKCDGLDEQSCLVTSGCYAAYDEWAVLADAPSTAGFKGCWETAPSGPVQGGGCWELDAYECSRHDDCSAYFNAAGDSPNGLVAPQWARCAPEPTTQGCAAVDCGPGSHCEEQCYPCDGQMGPCDPFCSPMCVPDDQYSCANVDCGPGYSCVEACDQMDPTAGGGAVPPGQCYPTCVPVGGGDPGACTGQVNCFANAPACPVNTVPGILNGCWSGYCIPQAACGPQDPGTCDPATCAVAPPACPADTVAGTTNGCYTGYCIPTSSCPQATCESLTTESACAARAECSPVYAGSDCTCSPAGCTCATLAFDRCETWWL